MYHICFFSTSLARSISRRSGRFEPPCVLLCQCGKRKDSERRPYARNSRNQRDVSPFVPQNNSGRNYVNLRWKHYSTSTKIAYKIEHPACTKPEESWKALAVVDRYFLNKKQERLRQTISSRNFLHSVWVYLSPNLSWSERATLTNSCRRKTLMEYITS